MSRQKQITMNIEIRFVHAKRSVSLEGEVTEKLNKLHNKYDWITNAAVFLKEEKHDKGEDYECEIRLSVPGPQIFAQTHSESFSKSISIVIRELDAQLSKKKNKMQEKR